MIWLRAAETHCGNEHQDVHDQVHLRGQRREDPVGTGNGRDERVEQRDDRVNSTGGRNARR
jgi:hypothetical protein